MIWIARVAVVTAALAVAWYSGATQEEPAADPDRRRTVALVVYDGMEILDFAGPGEVFAASGGLFDVFTVAGRRETILSQGFVKIEPDHAIADSPWPDILVIPGGGTRPLRDSEAMMAWIRRAAERAEIVMSVCSGAYVLAEAGLLDGREATTWYGAIDHFRRKAPRTVVHENVRFVDNGQLITTAGVSAGIDGALHVVGKLFGPDRAAETAAYMEYDRWVPGDGHVVDSEENRRYARLAAERRQREAGRAVPAQQKDGVQVARIVLGDAGFEPAAVALTAGVPARIVFERQSDSVCAARVKVPELGIEPLALAVGEAKAVEFVPSEAGRFRFACGMDMMGGAFFVEGSAAG